MKYMLGFLVLFTNISAFAYMDKAKILDGFVNRQRAPQMAGPVPYKKTSDLFHGKKGKLKEHAKKSKKKGKK